MEMASSWLAITTSMNNFLSWLIHMIIKRVNILLFVKNLSLRSWKVCKDVVNDSDHQPEEKIGLVNTIFTNRKPK